MRLIGGRTEPYGPERSVAARDTELSALAPVRPPVEQVGFVGAARHMLGYCTSGWPQRRLPSPAVDRRLDGIRHPLHLRSRLAAPVPHFAFGVNQLALQEDLRPGKRARRVGLVDSRHEAAGGSR